MKTNNNRRFPNVPKPHSTRPDTYSFRVEEANERNAATTKLTPIERIERLDRRLGKGMGAKKERARLHQMIEVTKIKK